MKKIKNPSIIWSSYKIDSKRRKRQLIPSSKRHIRAHPSCARVGGGVEEEEEGEEKEKEKEKEVEEEKEKEKEKEKKEEEEKEKEE